MTARVLVAGVGNIFLGDDGFGVEVARALARRELPERVHVGDYGTSGMHLAFDLLDGYDMTILVDAAPRGEEPGTVSVLDLRGSVPRPHGGPPDGHGMHPEAVLSVLDMLGGSPGHMLVVGCEPVDTGQRMGLSRPVERAVGVAVRKIEELVAAPAPVGAEPDDVDS